MVGKNTDPDIYDELRELTINDVQDMGVDDDRDHEEPEESSPKPHKLSKVFHRFLHNLCPFAILSNSSTTQS